MALFKVKTSKKVETSMRLEESTAKMLDRYAHYHKGSADDVVNESLEYIFRHDKDFQQYLTANPTEEVADSVFFAAVLGDFTAAGTFFTRTDAVKSPKTAAKNTESASLAATAATK